jgi:collagenase-like PrtC family protease
MRYFNVPADFKNETIDTYVALNKKYHNARIKETYGQVSIGNPIGSGRANDLIPQVDINILKRYIDYSNQHDIRFNYSLNTTCLENREFTPKGIAEITHFLDQLQEAGVRSITIAMPSLMELIRINKYDFEIKASTLCQIVNPNRAQAFKRLGVSAIVLDESINRDFDKLTRIRSSFGDQTEIIINVICHKNCILEMFHHNQVSHDLGAKSNNPSATYYSHRCMMQRTEHASNIMKLAWVRPEDLKYYDDTGINLFKLQGRQAVLKGDMPRTVEAYMQESFEGNLVELLDCFYTTNSFVAYVDNKKMDGFIKPFVNDPNFCKNDCQNCNYCDNFARKHTDYAKIEEVFETAACFYKECDHFSNMVQEHQQQKANTNISQPEKELFKDVEDQLEFDF